MVSNELPHKVRTLFISDLHLGYWISRGQDATEILRQVAAETIYLVGDVVDEVRMKLTWCWPESHQVVLDTILELGRSANVIAIPGNHDPFLRSESPLSDLSPDSKLFQILEPLLSFERSESCCYETLDGKKFYVTHGDVFDDVWQSELGVTKFGSKTFDRFNRLLPRRCVMWTRDFFKLFLARPKQIEQKIIAFAKESGHQGVIFGHLHEPKLYSTDSFIVGNCGDWVSNRSFLIETLEGKLELFNFNKRVNSLC